MIKITPISKFITYYEETFLYVFFPCSISSSAAYSFCTKDPCSILDKNNCKNIRDDLVSPCISKNKALLYILQQIDNY